MKDYRVDSNQLGVFGVDYKSASFDIRERMAFSKDEIPRALHKLRSSGLVREVVILSTCNRTEIYCVAQNIEFVINIIGEIKNLCPRTVIKKYCYIHTGVDCVRHLFRIVSGLESMVLGETEIVAQVKEAYAISKKHNVIARELSGLFQMSLSVEKDVRNVTDINNIAVSVGNAIINLIAVNFAKLTEQNILFVGAGAMMQNIAPYFENIRCKRKTVVNRSLNNAHSLAVKIGGDSIELQHLPEIIDDYAIIVACCFSDSLLLDEEILHQSAISKRQLLIIDISVPLVTDLHLRKYGNLNIVTVDDIAKIVDVGIEKRKQAASVADTIINSKLIEYRNWERKRGLSPVIRALRDNADIIRQEVLSGAQKQLLNGIAIESVLNELSLKLTNKLMHAPTVNLCAALGNEQDSLMDLLCYLYNLEVKVD